MGICRAYFDASESSPELGVMAVAGYWAYGEAWDKWFEGPWRNLLDDAGIDHFHMTEFESYLGPYRDWSKAKHKQFMIDAIRTINQTVGVGVGAGMDLRAFESRRKDWAKFGVKHPYHLCAHWCANVILKWINDHHPGTATAWIFEEGDLGAGDLLASIKELALKLPSTFPRMDNVGFAPKKSVLPLQASDFLAYETHKQALRKLERVSLPPRVSLLASLKSGPTYYSALLDGEFLDKLLVDMEANSKKRMG